MKFNVKVPGQGGEEDQPGGEESNDASNAKSDPVKPKDISAPKGPNNPLFKGGLRLPTIPSPNNANPTQKDTQDSDKIVTPPSSGHDEEALHAPVEVAGDAGGEGEETEALSTRVDVEEKTNAESKDDVKAGSIEEGKRETIFRGGFKSASKAKDSLAQVEQALGEAASSENNSSSQKIASENAGGKRRSLDFDAFVPGIEPVLEEDEDGSWQEESIAEEEISSGELSEVAAERDILAAGSFEEEDFYNPLLDSDDDEDELFTPPSASPKGPKPGKHTVIKVPDKPEVSHEIEKNFEKKDIRQEVKKKAQQKKPPRKELASDFDRKPLYEVEVNREGRGRAEDAKARATKAGNTNANTTSVVNKDGSEKWEVKSGAGKISEDQLDFFGNLNLGKRARVSRTEMKEFFGKIDETELTEQEKTRRKRIMNRALFGEDQVKRGSRRRFTEKDRDVLRFLAMFKYANAKHLARLHQVSEEGMLKRLNALKDKELLKKFEIFGAKPLWYLTEYGLIVSGMDLPRVKESGITYSMLPHQFVVNHTAGNLWGGGVNVLNLEDFPSKNRTSEKGTPLVGERLVSEYEIQSAFAQIKLTHKAETYKPMITGERDRQFDKWNANGGVKFGPSPELIEGNEFMWVLIPPMQLKLSHHIPDLVVKRDRASDGSPQSIAVEIELANKPYESYERTLRAYKYDSLLYGQVIWVVKSRGAARKLEEAAVKLDMWDDERVDIVPIYTEEGIFKGKAEWTL